MDRRELISALADGQLRGEGFAHGVQAAASEEGRSTWQAYCVVGEVLRTGQVAGGSAPDAFLAKLQARLQQEPARPALEVAAPARAPQGRQRPAANDLRWKLAAGLASVAAVAAVGWNVWGSAADGAATGAQLAVATRPAASVVPAVAGAEARSQPMLRDPRLDQLLAAHRQFGGGGALQSSSGFLRNATFEGPAR